MPRTPGRRRDLARDADEVRAAQSIEEHVLFDGSRHEIYRRYFDVEKLANELGESSSPGGRSPWR
jgi:hypothetical protein